MSKVLDLSAFVEETLDIKMPDGTTINLRKPSQKMVIRLIALRGKAEAKESAEDMLSALNDTVVEILNTNTNKRTFGHKEVDEMPINMKSAIIQAYSEYITGIQSDPNS